MTQTRWRIPAALLLSALVVGVSRGEEPAPAASPKKDCPVLTKLPYINRLFKNVSAPPSTPAAACPCKPGKPSEGCCCSEKTEKPAMRCCPVTGVCCPPKAATTACVPPPAAPMGAPCTLPAPVAVPMPPVGMYPYPPLPAPVPSFGMYAAIPPPPPDCGTYVVELKVMETRPGKEEKLVAQPQLRIMAGQTGSLCYPVAGKSFSATSSGEPQGMIGEQEVDVCVTPTGHNDRVLLDVTFQQVEQDSKAAKYYVERMSGVRMCKQVKLGKTVKLPCDLPSTGEKVHCRIEATIKKASASRDVSVAAPSMPPCSEPCPCPKPMDAPVCGPIAPVDCCIPVMPRCIEPAKKAPSPKLRLCVGHWADGKGVLEMRGSGAGLVLTDKTVVNLKGCVPLKIAIVDGQISLTGEQCSLKAKADHVSITPHGCLLLEGHVHVEGAGDDEVIEIQGGKVRLKLPRPCQTGVISSPTLIQ